MALRTFVMVILGKYRGENFAPSINPMHGWFFEAIGNVQLHIGSSTVAPPPRRLRVQSWWSNRHSHECAWKEHFPREPWCRHTLVRFMITFNIYQSVLLQPSRINRLQSRRFHFINILHVLWGHGRGHRFLLWPFEEVEIRRFKEPRVQAKLE